MLTLANVSVAHGSTYFSKDNYYSTNDNKKASEWWGNGAIALGLSGEVERKVFNRLLKGDHPDGGRLRNRKATGKERAGLDATLSAPKSVSMLALVRGDGRVEECHRQAVYRALEELEQQYALTRVRGIASRVVQPTKNLVIALFHHDTNREMEPQLHTHCLILNTTQGQDGRWLSLWADNIWQDAHKLGALYRNHLSAELQKLGYEIEPRQQEMFEVKGYSSDDLWTFSTRRAQIVEMVGENASVRDKQLACLATRKCKPNEIERDHLRELWQTKVQSTGIVHPVPQTTDTAITAAQEIAEAADYYVRSLGAGIQVEDTWIYEGEQSTLRCSEDIVSISAKDGRGEILRSVRGIVEAQELKLADRLRFKELVEYAHSAQLYQQVLTAQETKNQSLER
jgi:conjugative relaxase-like TrwC/TraI family protein